MNNTEMVVFGHKRGEPDYTEILLVTHWERVKDKEAALHMIANDGWVYRIAVIDLSQLPDFSKTINR